MPEIYLLALAILVASLLAMVMRRLRQPLTVSYILAGIVLAVFGLVRPSQLYFLQSIPEIGLALLLFLVGMELDLGQFKNLGTKILLTAIGQVVVTSVLLTLIISRYLPLGSSVLAAVALSFSSTILVVKLLIEQRNQASLHGKTAVGILLVEDLLAVVILMFQAVANGNSLGLVSILIVIIKGLFLIWLALFSGRRLLPKIFKYIADNQELLFLTAVAWCLVFVSLSLFIGFSTSIGAFLAGVSLAQSAYRVQISGRIKPLRDFFIMLFFINLGAQLDVLAAGNGLVISIILALYMALGKPILIFLLLVTQRFRVRPAFQTSVLLSSISEFSLIILFLAATSGLVPKSFLAPVILAVVLSFIVSPFLITHSRSIYRFLAGFLKHLERKQTFNLDFLPEREEEYRDHAILIGCHRSGQIILKSLKHLFGDNLIVVDFNPDVVEEMKGSFTPCLYGDIGDPEILDRLNLKDARLVISTVRDLSDNLALLDALEKLQSKATVIITASDAHEAITLYERGAHHVSLPLNLEGASISHLIHDHISNLKTLTAGREKKLGELKRADNSS